MDAIARRGAGPAKELGYTVRWALLHPYAIFQGVREEGEEKWLCYVSSPAHAYDYRTGDQRKAWHNEVFLIYITDDNVIYNWRWEKADQTDGRLPENHVSRSTTRLL